MHRRRVVRNAALAFGLAVTAAAAALFAPPAAGGPYARPPGPRYLAFSSNRPGGLGAFDLYLYDRWESRLVPLPGINSNVDDGHPVLSRDGRLLAFTSARHPSKLRPGGIFLYDRETQSLVDMPGINTELCEGLTTMSADARFVGFTRFGSTQLPPPGKIFPSSIQVYDRRAETLVTPECFNSSREAWSAVSISGNGRWLLGVRTEPGPDGKPTPALFLYDRTEQTMAEAPPPQSAVPAEHNLTALSGDGRYLAFTTRPAPSPSPVAPWDLAVYDRKKRIYLETPGLNTPETEEFPSFSRDGRYLAYETRPGGNLEIRLYDLRERRLLPLPGLNSEAKDRHPALSQE